MSKNLIFSTTSEIIRIPDDKVVYIAADGNYSAINTADGAKYTLTMQLGQIETRLSQMIANGDNRFIRIGKSLIVNRDFIIYINPSHQRLTLSDCHTFKYDVSASRDALKSLKYIIESEMIL